MENILYLDDYINLYNLEANKTFKVRPAKGTLYKGVIFNKKEFKRSLENILSKNKLNKNILGESIMVVYNKTTSEIDKDYLKDTLEELNYKKITFINELKLFPINKNQLLINYNFTYYYIYYVDTSGKVKVKVYDNDYLDKEHIIKIIKKLKKKSIVIFGKNYSKIINFLKENNMDYYYYEDASNLIIELLKNHDV